MAHLRSGLKLAFNGVQSMLRSGVNRVNDRTLIALRSSVTKGME
jgi:hypothetical protein